VFGRKRSIIEGDHGSGSIAVELYKRGIVPLSVSSLCEILKMEFLVKRDLSSLLCWLGRHFKKVLVGVSRNILVTLYFDRAEP
jgi:hypothetical protein